MPLLYFVFFFSHFIAVERNLIIEKLSSIIQMQANGGK